MKKIFTFAIALVCALAVNAQTVSVVFDADEANVLQVNLSNPGDEFCGFQADLYLPTGVEVAYSEDDEAYLVENGSRCAKKYVSEAAKKDGYYTVLQYITSNKAYTGEEGEIMRITLTGQAEEIASLKNIVIARADGTKATIELVEFGCSTGINDVKAESANAPIYNLQGVQVKNATKGVFIQNGKKYIVK